MSNEDEKKNAIPVTGTAEPNGNPPTEEAPEDKVYEQWYAEAKDVTLETLPTFLHKLAAYPHSYSSIVWALTAGAVAACWALDRTPNGGITGFQAGGVMWEFIRQWGFDMKGPLKLTKYKHMLYPQYEHQFQKTVSKDVWDQLQKMAKEKLAEKVDEDGLPLGHAHPDVLRHWQSIVEGNVPFGYVITED
jgi:hypothetical protein